ncbi:MAG: GtrA family protein [Oscillospiraceae bacterium]|nr:GtrA family protein [Clostridiales bacterium]MCI7573615.1 GtrA family protein [Clostridiales bacterium]MDD7674652.1 GtrA family protein [Oscillospiraceae bacterium]MDY5643054.1 GtrA family protein [Candidatus Faecousia sp.]
MDRKELLRAVKFTLFSISAGVIEIVSFSLLTELTVLPYWPCYLIALVLSVLWNFTFNRRYTFRSAGNVPKAMALVAAYYCVFTPLSTLGGNFLANLGWNEYLVTGLNMVVNFVTEFLYDKYVVFRGTVDTNSLANPAEDR